jgi:hypothetical protein
MENKKLIVVCGDSFNYGIGCVNLHTQPYGVLTAKHFNWDLVRLARGSASNYTIFLQGKYAAQMTPKPHLVILGTTSYDRIEWVATGKKLDTAPNLHDVNYHLYPPHHEPQPLHDRPMDFYLKDDPLYDPKILSEQVVAFDDYLCHLKHGDGMIGYYERLHTESAEKIALINRYYFDIVDSQIKADYDRGVIMMAYHNLKKKGINCIICSNDPSYAGLVDEWRDYFCPEWYRLTTTWPDSVNSLHTGEEGHADLAGRLIQHINDEGFV